MMAMKSKSYLHSVAGAMALGLLATGGIAAEGASADATAREPVGQVDVVLAGELDSRVLREVDLEDLAFTSFPPCGLVFVVR